MVSNPPPQRPAPMEKRKKNRRLLVDQREEVRFEPLTENRRQNPERRSYDKDMWKTIG
ncbi:MAG: hypothetical protein HN817_04320 [Porticoccaceae bacterium]|nr:hypothetical protein [Porticoccaceae bacterium]